jgi:hypothetical protein
MSIDNMYHNFFTKIRVIGFGLIVVFIINPSYAFAYIDPNTGGFMFQLLFPIVSAIGLAYLFFKNQIKKVCNKIKRSFKSD